MPFDPDCDVSDPALGLTYQIYGEAPVQTDGSINGMPFYFRARHAAWSFTVCISHDIDPSTISPRDGESGFFQYDEFTGYYLWAHYGVEQQASFMPYPDVKRIIRECVEQFLRDHKAKH